MRRPWGVSATSNTRTAPPTSSGSAAFAAAGATYAKGYGLLRRPGVGPQKRSSPTATIAGLRRRPAPPPLAGREPFRLPDAGRHGRRCGSKRLRRTWAYVHRSAAAPGASGPLRDLSATGCRGPWSTVRAARGGFPRRGSRPRPWVDDFPAPCPPRCGRRQVPLVQITRCPGNGTRTSSRDLSQDGLGPASVCGLASHCQVIVRWSPARGRNRQHEPVEGPGPAARRRRSWQRSGYRSRRA
jgi:hypothetical protein